MAQPGFGSRGGQTIFINYRYKNTKILLKLFKIIAKNFNIFYLNNTILKILKFFKILIKLNYLNIVELNLI